MTMAFGSGATAGPVGPAQAAVAMKITPLATAFTAVMLASGARPDELDGIVSVLQQREAAGVRMPRNYEEIALDVRAAINQYRKAKVSMTTAISTPPPAT